MAKSFKTARAGEPLEIEADWKNTGNEVFQEFLRRQKNGGQPPVPDRSRVTITVQNKLGLALNHLELVGLGTPVFLPATSLNSFKFSEPVFQTILPPPLQPFGVLLDPIGIDGVGDAVLEGLAVAKVSFTHDKMPYADGDTTVATLEGRGDGYAQVLWKESGTGDKWAVLLLGAGPRGYFPVDLATTAGQTSGANGVTRRRQRAGPTPSPARGGTGRPRSWARPFRPRRAAGTASGTRPAAARRITTGSRCGCGARMKPKARRGAPDGRRRRPARRGRQHNP
jgi:hypothetical protein